MVFADGLSSGVAVTPLGPEIAGRPGPSGLARPMPLLSPSEQCFVLHRFHLSGDAGLLHHAQSYLHGVHAAYLSCDRQKKS